MNLGVEFYPSYFGKVVPGKILKVKVKVGPCPAYKVLQFHNHGLNSP